MSLSIQSNIVNGILIAVIGLQTVMFWHQHRKHQQERDSLQNSITKLENMRETERKGRIKSQKRARQHIIHDSKEHGYRYQSIGTIESPFPDRRGTPRQPLLADAAKGKIRFNKRIIQHDYFKELQEFSHIWILFVFHENTNTDSGTISAKICPPRLGRKVGCLSTRSPHRPNNIGLSVCKIVRIGEDYIEVSGLDMVDGTPVIDVKPYIPCDSIPISPADVTGSYAECMQNHHLSVPAWIASDDVILRSVHFHEDVVASIDDIIADGVPKLCSSSYEVMELIRQVLRQDIRGIAQGRKSSTSSHDEQSSISKKKEFMCRLDQMLIRFITDDEAIEVVSVSGYKNATVLEDVDDED